MGFGGRDGPQGYGSSSGWEFFDVFYLHYTIKTFEMFGFTETKEGTEWTGVWSGYGYELYNFDPIYTSRGSFTATIVPVPAAVWFFISGFVLLFRHRFQRLLVQR